MLKGKKVNLSDIRRHLHANPELSGHEQNTAQYVANQLEKIGVDGIIRNIGGTSLLAEIGSPKATKCMLVRAELDALPIQEINQFTYKSKIKGVSHKCGHDGHMTILLGLAQKLKSNPLSNTRVLLLFQTAEEIGTGAKSVIDSGVLNQYSIDGAIALHNIPGERANLILSKEKAFTPSVLSVKFGLKGKETHAAMPQSGVNPSYLIADIINYAQERQNINSTDDNFILYTPIELSAGKDAYGTAAGNGTIGFTMRAWDNELLQKHLADLKAFVHERAKESKIELVVDVFDEFEANNNDSALHSALKRACKTIACEFKEMENPFTWGEDFGAISRLAPSMMFGLGAGETCPDLHNPDYDFPDEIVPTGVNVFYQTLKEIDKK